MFVVLLFLQLLTLASAAHSRYALCLSGGIRTFTHTIPRYIQFLETNKRNGGVDVFMYVYDDTEAGSKPMTKGIPDAVPIQVRQFFQRPEVISFQFEILDAFPKIKRELNVGCNNMNQNRMLSCLMQANKILRAMELVNLHVHSKRNGEEYSLVIRSRPDILFPPQPLDLSKFDNVVRRDKEKLIDDVDGSFKRKFMDQLNPKFKNEVKLLSIYNDKLEGILDTNSSSSASRIDILKHQQTDSKSHQIRFLFVPMCGDWNGINDQFAIGTTEAMQDYAQRLYTWKDDHPLMKGKGNCEGDSDRHTLLNLLGRISYTKVYRFVFDYTLLREKNVAFFLRDPENYQEVRSIISAGANGLNEVVDVGTTCARNPAIVNGFKDLRRQVSTSGRKEWTAEMLKCKVATA